MPHSLGIGVSGPFGFADLPYIESVHFTNRSCPLNNNQIDASFTTTNSSRSEVNFFVDPEKPECALPISGSGFTFMNLNEQCGISIVPGETITGLTFEPRCLVVTIAAESRKDLFDQLLTAGRRLSDPLRVLVNFTTALEPDPDIFAAATNCQNSIVLEKSYEKDKVLQDEFEELAEVRLEIEQLLGEIEFAEYALANTRFFQPAPPPLFPSPSPPPTSPPGSPSEIVISENPPSPPTAVTSEAYIQQLNNEIAIRRVREQNLLTEIKGCESFGGSRTRVCGLSVVEAPNPWISKSGVPCRGNATKSTRYGDFCAYFDSTYNVDGAPADEKNELIKSGPWCFADDLGDEVLECDGRAQRTQRAGVFELKVSIHAHHTHRNVLLHFLRCGSIGSVKIGIFANSNSLGRESHLLV